MIPGGIADKQGNRYEAKWLVLKLLDVLRGSASALQFEGTGAGFDGFEFLLLKETTSQWHQVKISNTAGNWTTNRLKTLGVLDAFKKRLAFGVRSDSCHFVSQDPSNSLRDLTDRARTASDFANFHSILSKVLSRDFREISDNWETDAQTAFSWLRRIYFRIESEEGLDEAIEAYAGLTIAHESSLVFGTLRTYMEERFNKLVTTDVLRRELPDYGLALKHWELDETLPERLQASTHEYLTSFNPVRLERLILRKETELVLHELLNPDGAKVILLTGSAGSGKSVIIQQVIQVLQSDRIAHVAMRADAHLEVATSEELGIRLTSRQENPVVTLKGVSASQLSVMVIDQVDAVSEISGRQKQLKSLILRMLGDAEKLKTVKVLCACRAFDLDNDARLKALSARQSVLRLEVAPLSWEQDVAPRLQVCGVDPGELSQNERKLLELPLNLGLYLEVHDEGQHFGSRNDLFARLLTKKRRSISQTRALVWSLEEPLEALSKWMSTRQTLQATPSCLRKFVNASDILASENLIVVKEGKIQFFHESFFDYLYALGFVEESQTLTELLLSDEQHLFRRTQVRQVLEALREDKRERYLEEVRQLFSNRRIRFHIKLAVAQWMGALENPTPSELQIVLRLDTSNERFTLLVRSALFQKTGWFDIVNAAGLPIRELYSAHAKRMADAIQWLTSLVSVRSLEIMKLLTGWCMAADTENRAKRLLHALAYVGGNKLDNEFLALLGRLLDACPQAVFNFEDDFAISTIFERLFETDSTIAAQVVSRYLRRWFDLHPVGHPFTEELKIPMSRLSEMAESEPDIFVLATIEALQSTIARLDSSQASPLDGEHIPRQRDPQFSIAGNFFNYFHTAIVAVAAREPGSAARWLNTLNPPTHEVFLHLQLSAIAASPMALASRLVPLLSAPRLFSSGWLHAPHQVFAIAARAALPHLEADKRLLVEARILSDVSELKSAAALVASGPESGTVSYSNAKSQALSQLRRSGREQLLILSSIGRELLSPKASARLSELQRKFESSAVTDSDESQSTAVATPRIMADTAQLLTDEDWLSVISKSEVEEKRAIGKRHWGGSQALATRLRGLAEDSPARFATLTEKIPDDAPPVFIYEIISGIRLSDVDGVEQSIVRALLGLHRRRGHPWGVEITEVVKRHSALAVDDELYEALCWYARFGHQPPTEFHFRRTRRPTLAFDALLGSSDDLGVEALAGARGNAVTALSSVFQTLPERRATAPLLIEKMVETELELSVRYVLVFLVEAFLPDDVILCAMLLRKLAIPPDSFGPLIVRGSLSTLTTRAGARMLKAIAGAAPATAEELITALVASEDEYLRATGAYYLIARSYYDDNYVTKADALLRVYPEYNKLAADGASEAIVEGELTQRALAAIGGYFASSDWETRSNASGVFWEVPPENFAKFTDLARDYVNSNAFQDDPSAFFNALDEAASDVSELVILAAEKLVMRDGIGNVSMHPEKDLSELIGLLSKTYALTEYSPALRKRFLDVLDFMLSHEIHSVEDTLTAHERD